MDNLNFNKFSLRKFTEKEDEQELFAAIGDPRVTRHMATKNISKEDCRKIIEESLKHWDSHGIGSWAVLIENRIVGWAGFKLWKQKEYELLIVLGPKSWGLGKSIYESLISMAKNKFHLEKVIIILPETRKSFTYVVKRAGFSLVGTEIFNNESFQKFSLSLISN